MKIDPLTRRDAAKLAGSAAIGGILAAPPASAAGNLDEICGMTATRMATAIRSGKLSARDAMTAHLRRVEAVNPKVNAIVTLVADQAMAQAAHADEAIAAKRPLGPLHGLPVVIKDLHDTAGIRTTYGSPLFQDNVPTADTIGVERLKHAGAIVIGKSNTPEFGAGSQTFNEVFGATHNPYDLTKTCGGSSGGAAVSLACNLVPLADGSDMGGSLRNPASFCNVVGLRSSHGRVPELSNGMAWFTLSVPGPMARNVADLALMLSVLAGPDDRSPVSISEPGSQFARPLARDCKGLRIAWMKEIGGMPFEESITHVVSGQRKVFESLGCKLDEAAPDFTGADEAFKTLRAWSFENRYSQIVKSQRAKVKDTVIWEVERGAKLTGPQISRAEVLKTQLFHRMRVFFEKYDYFVLPVTQVPPFDLHQPYPTEVAGQKMETYIDWMKSCYYISITGYPAISVPAGFTPEGLPVGLQIVGKHRNEWGILQLAHAFEQATKFGEKRPGI
jgi:amidase